jgi:hypothetical protein
MVAKLGARNPQRLDLGMRRRIMQRDVAIPPFADHHPIVHQYRANGYLVLGITGVQRQLQRAVHVLHIRGRRRPFHYWLLITHARVVSARPTYK